MKPILIVVAGGSGSGKTTVVTKIVEALSASDDFDINDITTIKHDDYYKHSDEPIELRRKVNYDHPDSLDNELLFTQLGLLLNNESIDKPIYDFVKHNRKDETEKVKPTQVIILEGILALADSKVRDLANIKLYVESDDDTRFIRRLVRDMHERGRSLENVITQYVSTVKPMYYKFVKPSKRYADIIIPNNKKHDVAVNLMVTQIKEISRNSKK